MKQRVWSVSSLVKYLKHSLDNDVHIQSIFIQGEISNFTHHRSNHLYFTLKEQGAKMNCVMFASHAARLKINPKEGMKVIVQANVSLYEAQGNIQLYVIAMQSDGVGDLYLQLEALKEKLHKQGLFDQDHKKPLPMYPRNIGIISAKTGAAIQDVLAIIARRWPLTDVHIYPSLVQGESASQDMISKLKEADTHQHDIILLVRGGGSLEDLWCFNDESLAICIYEMNTCIVSGVGHETDTTLVDYVSDFRAPTPSAAAELITPDKLEVQESLLQMQIRMKQCMTTLLDQQHLKIQYYKQKPIFLNKEFFVQNRKMQLDMYIEKLCKIEKEIVVYRHSVMQSEKQLWDALQSICEKERNTLQKQVALLDAFSPLKILKRGYSITMIGQKAVRSIDDIKLDDELTIHIDNGLVVTKVLERKSKHGGKNI